MEEIADLTDVGNAERFIDHHKEYLRYCPQLKQWLLWNGNRWEIDTAGRNLSKGKRNSKNN